MEREAPGRGSKARMGKNRASCVNTGQLMYNYEKGGHG
jgi:hypothetical protein